VNTNLINFITSIQVSTLANFVPGTLIDPFYLESRE